MSDIKNLYIYKIYRQYKEENNKQQYDTNKQRNKQTTQHKYKT